ncbi:MAG: Tex family protein [Bacteroidota bacterium]|nr:Tex family protein [Bacteroidota bacterium]
MNLQEFIPLISSTLNIATKQVNTTIQLLNEGGTVPFIARYRKEKTNGLDEVQIEQIRLLNIKFTELVKRKQLVIQTIQEQGKLTDELKKQIVECWDPHILEDIYLPYKPKRKTKASIARDKGLEPLALWIMKEWPTSLRSEVSKYVNKKVSSEDEALEGARDIIAEIVNEDAYARSIVRNVFSKQAIISTKLQKGKDKEGEKYKDYFKFEEMLSKCPSHRLLAMFRGENEGFLKLSIEPDNVETAIYKLENYFVRHKNETSKQFRIAVNDSYKRLIAPSIENEFRAIAKIKADEEAIKVFAENLKQLLLAPPLGSKRILAIDPGIRTGCKVVCINEEGKLLTDDIIYPFEPQRDIKGATETLISLVSKHKVEAIAIGNGTAGRETEEIVRKISFPHNVQIFLVNESGASIYSASEIAREEFPKKDITVRGAVSIGRRLADPLAELVKIDPKSIGVGQYQHDVDQNKLKESLDAVVVSCVNNVGVNLNTASKSLLTYVSGLGPQLATNIIEYRNTNGAFVSRDQLKKIPRLGEKAFEQCAAFLRIPNGKNVLDNSAVHPESYDIVSKMAMANNCTVNDLIKNEGIRKSIKPEQFVTATAGLPTINDILQELAKPGRDPRAAIEEFKFSDIKKPEDLYEGMVLPGIVTNITKFGCFVDIGVKQDGLVHISQMADKYVSDPNLVVKLQQKVKVKVMEVDVTRKRISLSMKGL